MAAPDKITVAVRVRPLGEHGVGDVVVHDASNSSIIIGVDRSFRFDHIFTPETDQTSVYDVLVAPLIKDCLKGINATVLAYGQTGSGKTYTMGTAFDVTDFSISEETGIIPRAIVDVFRRIEELSDVEVEVEAQFIELYNEEIRDLLTPKRSVIRIQEKVGGGIHLSGATSVRINSVHDALFLIRSGGESRSTGSTKMNAQSSRSHAILTLNIVQRKKVDGDTRVEAVFSKFHFVDLAGSERLGRTGAEGERAKEGIKINYGLLALGNVINALSENQKHIPYRDSKLTRLLCDSLGGNSRTVLIACISPAEIDMGESLNTLQYANRAKKIRNTIAVNVTNMTSADAETLKKLLAENRRLRQQLKLLSHSGSVGSRGGPHSRGGDRPTSSSTRPALPLRAKENLTEIVRSFDKIMAVRVKQMSEITRVGSSRFEMNLRLNHLKMRHAVLEGCGDPQANQLVAMMRSLERELEETSTRVTSLADALGKSAASVHELLGKVERAIQTFPPSWQHVPQTIRSAMSTRLSNADSSGLQCYNSNLINVLQFSEATHARSLAVVKQLHHIAGPALLRSYLPNLIGTVGSMGSLRMDDGRGLQPDGPSISSLLPNLFEGSTRRRPGVLRSAAGGASSSSKPTAAESRRGILRKAAGATTTTGTRKPPSSSSSNVVSSTTSAAAAAAAGRMSYVAAVGSNHMPEEYLNMLEAQSSATALSLTSSVEPPIPRSPHSSKSLGRKSPSPPRTVVMADGQRRRLSPTTATTTSSTTTATLPRLNLMEMETEDEEMPQESLRQRQQQQQTTTRITATGGRHHHVPVSSRVVWHNGLPLPVVDCPEQENCPPADVSMQDVSSTAAGGVAAPTVPTTNVTLNLGAGEVLRSLQQQLQQPTPSSTLPTSANFTTTNTTTTTLVTKRPITDEEDDDIGAAGTQRAAQRRRAGDEGSNNSNEGDDAAEGEQRKNEEGGKTSKFRLRPSIMERFQRCGIDFNTFAPP